jgi:hypothetical protein
VQDQHDVARQFERFEPRVEVARVIGEPVGPIGGRARLTHADQIGRQAPPVFMEEGNDVPPEIGRRGVAVQEHDRVTGADVDVAHLGIENADAPPGMKVRA